MSYGPTSYSSSVRFSNHYHLHCLITVIAKYPDNERPDKKYLSSTLSVLNQARKQHGSARATLTITKAICGKLVQMRHTH